MKWFDRVKAHADTRRNNCHRHTETTPQRRFYVETTSRRRPDATRTPLPCHVPVGIVNLQYINQTSCIHDNITMVHRSPVNSSHKGQWRGALLFSLICAWTNGWANHRDAGDLRRYRDHHDVTVKNRPKQTTAYFVQVNTKANFKTPHYWSFARGIRRWPVRSSHRGSITREAFPCHDVTIREIVMPLFLIGPVILQNEERGTFSGKLAKKFLTMPCNKICICEHHIFSWNNIEGTKMWPSWNIIEPMFSAQPRCWYNETCL